MSLNWRSANWRSALGATSLTALLATAVSPIFGPAHADTAIIVGGGYKLSASQGQIELNVKWAQDVLKRSGLQVHTFFTDGDDPAVDVHVAADDNSQPRDNEALTRVFSDMRYAWTRYHSNTVPDLSGGTDANDLLPAITGILSDSSPDDLPPLLVYNGHGGPSNKDADDVTLKLWNETRVTAEQLHTLLEKDNTDLRFVLTQCYSGGFHRIAYQDSQQGLGLSEAQRCGFTAESSWRISEGCSASINTEDYRDYTTFFFAALDGTTRNGEPLSSPVTDYDADGVTSLRDAHLHTIENAHSTDLSRSTSEDYLTTWQPWLERWLPVNNDVPDNEYGDVYRALLQRHQINDDTSAARTIRSKLKQHEADRLALVRELNTLGRQAHTLATTLRRNTIAQWPALGAPYEDSYLQLVSSGDMAEINQWLSDTEGYAELRDIQLQIAPLTDNLLNAERDAVQMRKLLRLRKLARLKARLYETGEQQHITDYERLVSCESHPLK